MVDTSHAKNLVQNIKCDSKMKKKQEVKLLPNVLKALRETSLGGGKT